MNYEKLIRRLAELVNSGDPRLNTKLSLLADVLEALPSYDHDMVIRAALFQGVDDETQGEE